jgi:hypothetical protein
LHVIQAAASARAFNINQYTATGSVTPTYFQLTTLASIAMMPRVAVHAGRVLQWRTASPDVTTPEA